ncbi:uncharacterized protein LOC135845884 [Planococcus citri]|uniref:uncharacterized protein LOC135845884 n=1 Tax=Planococcus citri TaxID=170843 RepID=UPI0031F9D1A9
MDGKTLINCSDIMDESICTVIILRYKVYRNDSGKLFGKLLFLKHKAENFLKEVFDEEVLFQNPTLQRTKQGLLELIQGLTYLCSGVTPTGEQLCIPELSLQDTASNESSYEMKFVKGVSLSDLWLSYVDNEEFLRLLQRLREKYDKDELQPFMFYPRIGEHVYYRQGVNIFRGVVLEYVILDENKEDDKEEADVDIKVLNIDNSDVAVLPQNCFFQLDKEGTELPMQCVRCTSDETNISFSLLQKHKLNVIFHRKKVPVEDSPLGAQSASISLCTDKNGVLVPRNSPDLIFATYADAVNSNQILNRSCQTSADEDDVCEGVSDESVVDPELNQTGETKPDEDNSYSSHRTKQAVDDVVVAMNNVAIDDPATKLNKDAASMNSKEKTKIDKIKPATKPVERRDSSLNDMAACRLKVTPNTVPSSSAYHYLSGPQFHSTPMHYPGHYMPYAATQHMNPAAAQFHFPQYPYGPYIPQTAPTIQPQPPPHTQPYYMPPSSTAYQSYVQPVAAPIMASYFPSQPPYAPGFYPVPPSQLPPSWPQVQPNYRVSTPSPVSVVSVAVNKAEAMNAVNSSANLNKPK